MGGEGGIGTFYSPLNDRGVKVTLFFSKRIRGHK